MIDVAALGELLIDLTQNGMSEQGNPILEANPGGAPCNVLALLSKMGNKAAFIGKVGKDGFGEQLTAGLKETGICTEGLLYDENVHTTLAVVHTYADGDRDFSFYRNPGADMMLRPEEVNEQIIRNSKIFHFGSLSMTDEPVRSAHLHALKVAEEAGVLRSYDPNLRPPLWPDLDTAKENILALMSHCDILKISDNEIQWFTGKEDFDEGIRILQDTYHIPLILLSLGRDGSRAYYKNMKVEAKPFLQKNTIETTGAGDTFCACVINYVLEHGLHNLTEENLQEMLTFANAAASLITTRKGALRVMPEKAEVEDILAKNPPTNNYLEGIR